MPPEGPRKIQRTHLAQGFRDAFDPRVIRPAAALFSLTTVVLTLWLTACQAPRPGTEARRQGDEILVCGRLFHTGTPVVLWTDPGGYDAYRVERRFGPLTNADWAAVGTEPGSLESPNRYGIRRDGLSPEELEQVRGGGWDLPLLRRVVDQFVLHYDASGTSRRCFEVLHDQRCLSVHFLLDVDGTLYQTLDLKERAWHATTSNTRSIGIEIAQAGAVSATQPAALDFFYEHDVRGPRLRLPQENGTSGIRTPGFVGRPARRAPITGSIQGRDLVQYDFTPEQYRALAQLTATLCRIFPRIRCEAPRDASGHVIPGVLSDDQGKTFTGILGHYHIQSNKVDPGPAFDWDRLLAETRGLLRR